MDRAFFFVFFSALTHSTLGDIKKGALDILFSQLPRYSLVCCDGHITNSGQVRAFPLFLFSPMSFPRFFVVEVREKRRRFRRRRAFPPFSSRERGVRVSVKDAQRVGGGSVKRVFIVYAGLQPCQARRL